MYLKYVPIVNFRNLPPVHRCYDELRNISYKYDI